MFALTPQPRGHAAAGTWFIAIERCLNVRRAVSCRLNGSFRQENPQWRIEMLHRALLGAAAGAAGNLALEVVTYGDMLFRGRSPSGVPAKMAGILARRFRHRTAIQCGDRGAR